MAQNAERPLNEALTPMVRELLGYQDRIIKCARDLVAMAEVFAPFEQIDAQIGFMDILQRHRRGVLWEYKRQGGRVKDVDTYGAHIEKDAALRTEGNPR